MVRIALGVIAGFLVWSILWVGGESFLSKTISPDWLGLYTADAEKALLNNTPFETNSTIAAIHLVRSIVTSIIAGYMCALVAGEYKRSTAVLGILLLVFGIAVQVISWAVAPVWYHVLFLLLLIPMTILGGRLRRPS